MNSEDLTEFEKEVRTSRYYTISYPKRTHDFVKMNFGFSVE
jgi:hypothetical protein